MTVFGYKYVYINEYRCFLLNCVKYPLYPSAIIDDVAAAAATAASSLVAVPIIAIVVVD